MKTNAEILLLINKKIEEHKFEIDGANDALKSMQKDKNAYKDMASATKLLVLKDKAMFHKACIAALDDLKQEIEK